ncbi:hypothetical protein SBK14_000393 [Providencia rettgeri]|nr:hypothetical protein [Providencia rettgeri]
MIILVWVLLMAAFTMMNYLSGAWMYLVALKPTTAAHSLIYGTLLTTVNPIHSSAIFF